MTTYRHDETDLLSALVSLLNASGRCQVWKNKTGALRATGRGGRSYPMRFGLGVGGAELVGLLRHGRFFSLEPQALPKQSDKQRAWQAVVEAHGGFYAVVRSIPEALAALERAETGG